MSDGYHIREVSHLGECLPAVLTSLKKEARDRNNAEALGLVTFMKKYSSLLLCTCFLLFFHI